LSSVSIYGIIGCNESKTNATNLLYGQSKTTRIMMATVRHVTA